MAGYKEIKGFQVQTRTEDPSPTEAQTGDFYYNSSTGQFKTINSGGAPIGTWASGGSLNDARSEIGGVGTQTAALCIGGQTPPETGNTETYDGSSWTEVNNLNTARRLIQGMGTVYTAALAVGGYAPGGYQSTVESWNGSSWTEITEVNSAKGAGGQSGTSTAGIAFAGVPPAPMATNEYWNGSSWTELNDLNTGRRNIGSAGTAYTAAIAFAGEAPSTTAVAEIFDGTSWTEVGDLNTARAELAGAGTSTAGLAVGGNSPSKAEVEAWNGTSWTEVSDLATGRKSLNSQSSNSSTSALTFGGYTTTYVANTEEFTAADFEIKSVTQS
jgi:hypothetical protein